MESSYRFDSWRIGIVERPRGIRRWQSRVRVYEAVSVRPELASRPSDLARQSGVAESTLYTLFGPSSDSFATGIMEHRILFEVKAWTFSPYLAGAGEVAAFREDDLVRAETVTRLVADWAVEQRAVAETLSCRAPDQAVEVLVRVMDGVDARQSRVAALLEDAVRMAQLEPSAGSLYVLNSVRSTASVYRDVKATAPSSSLSHGSSAAATLAIAAYGEALELGEVAADEARAALGGLIRRLVASGDRGIESHG